MKNLSNLGKALNKAEQKSITGGFGFIHADCELGVPGTPCFKYYRENGVVVVEEGVCNANQQCIF